MQSSKSPLTNEKIKKPFTNEIVKAKNVYIGATTKTTNFEQVAKPFISCATKLKLNCIYISTLLAVCRSLFGETTTSWPV